ncbi:MAG: hypothetical protein ACPGXY_06450 [Alphaproteobacteria bacterium]
MIAWVASLFMLLAGLHWNYSNMDWQLEDFSPVPDSFKSDALYRWRVLQLHHAGDMDGQVTSLVEYDYDQLVKCFTELESYKGESRLLGDLVTLYYAASPDTEQVRLVLQYLLKHPQHWTADVRAFVIAQEQLHDKNLAMRFATRLQQGQGRDQPEWTRRLRG